MKAASLALQQRSDYLSQQHQTMTTVAAEFDRSSPLFERNIVSFEVVTTPPNNNNNNNASTSTNNDNNKRNVNFTVRILEGRRSTSSGGDGERVIRFEMSNECNLVGDSLPTHQQQCTPSRSRATPIIHAPFMTVDRGGVGQGGHHSTMMQGGPNHHNHQSPHTRSSQPQQKSLNLPIELYELEVGESDFAALRRDQALLVDFNSFSDSLISLLQCCELSSDEGGRSSGATQQQTSQDANQYGQQQQPYDESISGGWNGGQGGGISRHSAMGQQWGSNNNSNTWSTPSHHQGQGGGMNYHGQRMMSSPFAKMNCSTTSMPVSTYACRLEIDTSSNDTSSMQQWRQNSAQLSSNNSLHARFSIVESNQFRELTHIALNLNVGTDKSVRCYLSSRYVII